MRIFSMVICFVVLSQIVYAQSFEFKRTIFATDTITDDGVTFAASSDDAEQENDEIDALYDDDIDAGWEGAPEDQNILTAGMRFQNILIPNGATIDSAFIVVYSHEAKSSADVCKLTIAAEATDNALTFNEEDLISARSKTTAQLKWEIAEAWGLWTPHRTPDIKEIVQEIITRDGWQSGNSLAFMFIGENQGVSEDENAREWESFENIADPEDGGDGKNHPERVPQLIVYYSVKSALLEIPIVATDTITDDGVTFAASSDDAEQENDEIDALFDDDIDAGWEGAPEDQNILTAGLRFQNIGVPQGAVIDSAFIEVYSHESKKVSDVAKLTIAAEATDHALTFNEEALISGRPRTTSQVKWEVKEEWGLWTAHRTPDIKEIITEIIGRDGWNPGNAIAFIILGENQGVSEDENAREWESFENIADPEDGGDGNNHPERVPRLLIYFSSPSGSVYVKDLLGENVNSLKVYPNPASHLTTIELSDDAPATIQFIDAQGRIFQNLQSNYGKVIEIETSKWPSGLYYIHAIQKDKRFVQKLLVNHK